MNTEKLLKLIEELRNWDFDKNPDFPIGAEEATLIVNALLVYVGQKLLNESQMEEVKK